MGIDEIIKAIVSAIIAFTVPIALKQFWPETEQVDSLPWFKWCVAGFVGGALGGIAGGAMELVEAGGHWPVFGVVIGLLQWFALRGYRSVGTWFVFASMLGWMLWFLGGVSWGWVVSGVAVGIMQYLSLAKWKGAGWWILANPIAWLIAGWAGIAVATPLLGSKPMLGWIIGWGVVGLVGAIILIVPLSRLTEK